MIITFERFSPQYDKDAEDLRRHLSDYFQEDLNLKLTPDRIILYSDGEEL